MLSFGLPGLRTINIVLIIVHIIRPLSHLSPLSPDSLMLTSPSLSRLTHYALLHCNTLCPPPLYTLCPLAFLSLTAVSQRSLPLSLPTQHNTTQHALSRKLLSAQHRTGQDNTFSADEKFAYFLPASVLTASPPFLAYPMTSALTSALEFSAPYLWVFMRVVGGWFSRCVRGV